MLRFILLATSVSVLWSLFGTPIAASTSGIVISHIQTGGAGSGTSSQEFIAIHNNFADEIDVSDWCVRYSDYSNTTINELYCFKPASDMDAILMGPNTTAVIVSPTYPVPSSILPTGLYKNTNYVMSGTRGHVTLFDHNNSVVDRVAWDNKASLPPTNPETLSATAPAGGNMIVRELVQNQYIDTDNNYEDFVSIPSFLPTISPLIDYKEPLAEIDVCPNIDGVQQVIPDNMGIDDMDNCELLSNDICANIDHIQLLPPINIVPYLDGNCYDVSLDVCSNVDGFQLTVPHNFRIISTSCKLISTVKKLQLSELLPNSTSVDIGNEFIEIHNTDTESIDLSDYHLLVGKNAEKSIALPEIMLSPDSYIAFTDVDLGFSLLNTTTQLKIAFYDGVIVDEIIPYQNPADEMAWALIDGVWQFTNRPTPSGVNIASAEVLSENTSNETTLEQCPAGKYRNPLTNRCRNIEADASMLAPCDVDEYRSPDTNRCRKILLASASLTPCDEGYERNPDTNRCRKISAEDSLAACQEGYERNPLTNRCKKANGSSGAVQAIEQITDKKTASGISISNPYTVAATVGVGVVGYGVYEWRTELSLALRRILGIFTKK